MASITLTVDDAHVPRLREAFGSQDIDAPKLASLEEIRQDLLQYAKAKVLDYERRKAQAAAHRSLTEITMD